MAQRKNKKTPFTSYMLFAIIKITYNNFEGVIYLREVGVSPWSNPEKCAEQLGPDFVFARKPNPAHVAFKTLPEQIYNETETAVKACLKYGCPAEFVLKDITTVSRKLENLTVWANTVSDVLDQYYGKA